ncbi:uncharacterized protein [Cherax quadricarinatus]|uniref:uncharacterized protein isoform X2 n=1 Tax=Cherax quadricarinatus TaxID=27406 RepID=UPI00387ED282
MFSMRASMEFLAVLACSMVVGETDSLRNTTTARLNTQPIVQELLVPTKEPPVSYFLLPRFLSVYSREPQANNTTPTSSNNKNKNTQGVKLPSLPCEKTRDCWQYTEPLLECHEGQCSCSPPFCWIYHYEVSEPFSAKYVFNCGTCGVLGSWCNASITCDWPGVCWSDNYCHCPRGENQNNLCVTTDTSWTYKMVLIGLALIVLFTSVLVAYNCYVNPPWRQTEPWCCGLCPGAQGVERRHSTQKTPAFTIQSHYASHESVLSSRASNDQGTRSESNVGGRTSRWRLRSISQGSHDNEGTSSISSVSTAVTSVSQASTETTSDGVAPATATSEPLAVDGDDHEQVFTINLNVSSETVNFQAPSEDSRSDDESSVGSLNSCSHERCSLCLPKGPMTRPSSVVTPNSLASGNKSMLHHFQTRNSMDTNIYIESTHL